MSIGSNPTPNFNFDFSYMAFIDRANQAARLNAKKGDLLKRIQEEKNIDETSRTELIAMLDAQLETADYVNNNQLDEAIQKRLDSVAGRMEEAKVGDAPVFRSRQFLQEVTKLATDRPGRRQTILTGGPTDNPSQRATLLGGGGGSR